MLPSEPHPPATWRTSPAYYRLPLYVAPPQRASSYLGIMAVLISRRHVRMAAAALSFQGIEHRQDGGATRAGYV